MALLALLMPLEMLWLVVFDYLYQFVQHTQYVPKLGPIEWVFNTPSHHRVHHGRQAAYIDKNYGGILIIWDRLFGTFQEEHEQADFGITMSPNSLNPVWGNFILWSDLARASRQTPGIWNKLKLGRAAGVDRVARWSLERRCRRRSKTPTFPRFACAAAHVMSGMPVLGALPWVMDGPWSCALCWVRWR